MRVPALIAASLLTVTYVSGCGSKQSPEQQVRAVVGALEVAAESRDVGDVAKHLADDYRDAEGNGREDALRMLRGYFIAHQSIHLLIRVDELTFPSTDTANATLTIGMVGSDGDTSWDLAADVYSFELAFRRDDDDWKLTFAKWNRGG